MLQRTIVSKNSIQGLNKRIKTELNIDNQSAMMLITNGVINRRSKHIDVKYRFVHDLVKQKTVKLKYCPTDKQIANSLTKPLNKLKFEKYRKNLVQQKVQN